MRGLQLTSAAFAIALTVLIVAGGDGQALPEGPALVDTYPLHDITITLIADCGGTGKTVTFHSWIEEFSPDVATRQMFEECERLTRRLAEKARNEEVL